MCIKSGAKWQQKAAQEHTKHNLLISALFVLMHRLIRKCMELITQGFQGIYRKGSVLSVILVVGGVFLIWLNVDYMYSKLYPNKSFSASEFVAYMSLSCLPVLVMKQFLF